MIAKLGVARTFQTLRLFLNMTVKENVMAAAYPHTRAGVRWKNVSSTEDYVARIAAGMPTATDLRRMDPDERLGDAIFTGLRMTDGVNLDAIRERYGVDLWERYGAALGPFLDEGCLVRDGGQLRLTRRGMLLAHEVMAVFV